MLDDVAIVWANHDPTNAMNWAGSLSDNAARGQALAAVAGEAVRSQPLMALQIALDLPAGQQRDDLIQRGAMQWASEDAASAAAWVSQIPQGDLRNQTLSGVAIVWSASAPVDAANWALKELPPGRLLDDTVVSIVQRWAQRDMDGATAWVEQFPEGALRAAAVENLLAQWSPTDHQGAALAGGALRKEFEIDHAAAATIIQIIDKLSGRVWAIFKIMKFLSLRSHAIARVGGARHGDMQIYSDRLNKLTESN